MDQVSMSTCFWNFLFFFYVIVPKTVVSVWIPLLKIG